MKTNRINLGIVFCNLILSSLVIYISPRWDVLTLLGLTLVNGVTYILLRVKDQRFEKKLAERIEDTFQLLHSLDPNISHYELVDDEFGKLRDEMAKMIVENKLMVKKSEENQEILREYTEDIAHQIKTPLTGALLMLDILEEDMGNAKDYIMPLRKSIHRLYGLVDALLKMASLDSGTIGMKREKLEIRSMLENLTSEMEGYFQDKPLEIPIYGEGFDLVCDRQWTYEAVFNIVKNGLEASPKKGVEIHLKETNIYKSIQVKDFSGGLTEEGLKKAYKRFYKSDSESKGFGIGLPMAKSIMEKQGGELLYQRGKGSNYFELRFYK